MYYLIVSSNHTYSVYSKYAIVSCVLWLLFLYKATSFASLNGFAWVLL